MCDNPVTFTNCRLCISGKLLTANLVFCTDHGEIDTVDENAWAGRRIDLQGKIVAPGYLELQTNGVNGFHFTHFENEEQYGRKLEETARYYATQGVTGFWVTIPTVAAEVYKKVCSHRMSLWCSHLM